MPLKFYIKDTGTVVFTEEKPFASGGEGALFQVLKPDNLNKLVAKIYHKNKRNDQKHKKTEYLIENPPEFEDISPGEEPIIWVKHILHNDKDEFVGFLMPKATGEQLEILTSPKLPRNLGKEWNRFRMGGDTALRFRLKVCYNIAAALRTIHTTGKYVLVDLKPDNILIRANGLVSVVDTDSIEVIENGEALYAATVATPEYTPAEYYKGVKPGEVLIKPSWDRFSMAVIFYRMLFGIHPFAATAKAPYNEVNSLGDKIKFGLFVHSPLLAGKFEVIPPPHNQFNNLDPELKQLFMRAFVDGFEDPEARPSAEDWGKAFVNHPLLLTNRTLPSRALNLEVVNKENWYSLALEKAMKDQNLIFVKSKIDAALTLSGSSSDRILQNASASYKKIGNKLLSVGKFVGLVSLVVTGMFILSSVVSGSSFSGLSYLLYAIFQILLFIPELILGIGGTGLLILVMLSPLLIATFNELTGNAKNNVVDIRNKFNSMIAFSNSKKKKSLEDMQYSYYNKRTKVKQRLREIRNELVVWSKIRSKKEQEFYQKNNQQILQSNREISGKIRTEKTALMQRDAQAKQLMIAEADQIKKIRLNHQQELKEDPVYSKIKGKTAEQKIATLQGNNSVFPQEELGELSMELMTLQKELREELIAVRKEYDEKHRAFIDESNENKMKIDDLVKMSINDMRNNTDIDQNLLNGSFKRLLLSIKKLESEVDEKEGELLLLNNDLAQIKEELKRVK